jgi:hypothetical protein
MKKKIEVIVLVVFVLVAALIWVFEWNREAPAIQMANSIENYKPLAEDDPQIRWGEMGLAQKTEYKSNGRNPFSVIAPPTPKELDEQRKLETARSNQQPVQQEAPKAPTEAKFPPNLKFFGYGTVPIGSTRRAFFTDGDDVYIVVEGETLLGRYRILKVGNTVLEFQEISSGLRGTTPLEEQVVAPSA